MTRLGAYAATGAMCLMLALGFTAAPPSPTSPNTSPPFSFADTLDYRIEAGAVLLRSLPDSLDGQPVETYAVVRAPAMSWLVDRSLMWRTHASDRGTHRLLLYAAPLDTIAVTVIVE